MVTLHRAQRNYGFFSDCIAHHNHHLHGYRNCHQRVYQYGNHYNYGESSTNRKRFSIGQSDLFRKQHHVDSKRGINLYMESFNRFERYHRVKCNGIANINHHLYGYGHCHQRLHQHRNHYHYGERQPNTFRNRFPNNYLFRCEQYTNSNWGINLYLVAFLNLEFLFRIFGYGNTFFYNNLYSYRNSYKWLQQQCIGNCNRKSNTGSFRYPKLFLNLFGRVSNPHGIRCNELYMVTFNRP
jgi:hypothetical protein